MNEKLKAFIRELDTLIEAHITLARLLNQPERKYIIPVASIGIERVTRVQIASYKKHCERMHVEFHYCECCRGFMVTIDTRTVTLTASTALAQRPFKTKTIGD